MTAHRVLTGLLVLQCALAAYTWYPRDTGVHREPVVPWEAASVQKIQLESVTTRNRGADLELARDGSGWKLLSEHGFPARTAPAQELLDRIMGLERARPITTDPSLHDKLNVADDNFTRRVTLHRDDGETLELFAGTASRERMNLRYAGDDAVYEIVGLGAWRMSDNPHSYLQVDPFEAPDTLAQLTLTNEHGEIAMQRDDQGTWTLVTGEPLKSAEVERLAHTLTHIDVSDPVDPSDDPRMDPVVTVQWTTPEGSTGGYVGARRDDRLLIRVTDSSLPPFLISPVDGQPELLDTTLDTVLESQAPEEP